VATNISMRFFVTGRVQGVWFRASTQEKAEALGVTGWVRNLPDGRVEVLATGDFDKVANLHAWLEKGPELAIVEEVLVEEAPFQKFDRFSIE